MMLSRKSVSVYFLAVLIATTVVSAMGVSPGSVKFDYIPNASFETQACFSNAATPTIRVEKSGYLAEYIEFLNLPPDNVIDITKSDGCVEYRVTLPSEVDKYGSIISKVSAVEMPESVGGNVVAIVRMSQRVQMDVPYPGKYLEITGFSVSNTRVNESVPITVNVQNKGKEVISFVTGEIGFFDKNNNKVGQATLETVAGFQPQQTREYKLKWAPKNLQAGNYQANLIIDYDGLKAAENRSFKLGTLGVEVKSYTTPVLYQGIQPFSVNVDSLWSEAIPGVKAKVSVYRNVSTGLDPIESFDTLSANLRPWDSAELKGFIDTQKVGLGKYDIVITLEYADQTKEQNGRIEVIEPPKPVPPKKEWGKLLTSTTALLTLLVIILLIILVIVIVILLPKKKQSERNSLAPGSKASQGKEEGQGKPQ